jgi:hypothetical protein
MRTTAAVLVLLVGCSKDEKRESDKPGFSDPTFQLEKLARAMKRSYTETAMFPVGKAGPTPSKPCCSYADHKCPSSPEEWQTSPWKDIGFELVEPSSFQFTYESDGKAASVTATADVACNGTMKTWKLDASVVAGNPATVISSPP